MTAPVDFVPGAELMLLARGEGLAPALDLLCSAVLPGLVPFGAGGHAIGTPRILSAPGAWLDGLETDRDPDREHILRRAVLPGGEAVIVGWAGTTGTAGSARADDERHRRWSTGLLWLRLGLSEALRDTCLTYLAGRRSGPTATLIQQQLVKGAIAEAVTRQLEVHAVLCAGGARTEQVVAHLHAQVSAADRELVRLLGASGYATGGPGESADLSELLADVYRAAVPPC